MGEGDRLAEGYMVNRAQGTRGSGHEKRDR